MRVEFEGPPRNEMDLENLLFEPNGVSKNHFLGFDFLAKISHDTRTALTVHSTLLYSESVQCAT